jgi:hypothetical protein
MMATYDSRDGWNAGEGVAAGGWGSTAANLSRCTSGAIRPRERIGPWPYYYTQPIYLHMYWKGIQINVPGAGKEQMLALNAGQPLPTNGVTYRGTTKSGWKIGCLPSIKNGAGEGFTVTTNDGVTYHFDWMATRKAVDLTDNGETDVQGNGTQPWHLLAPLTDVYLYVSKVIDRFGNSVNYTYDPANPQRIVRIESNDGARLDVQYNASGLISSISSGSRVWTYAYNGRALQSLQLPDGSYWSYSGDFVSLSSGGVDGLFWSNGCNMQVPNIANARIPAQESWLQTLVITHPSGARGEFKTRGLYHGTNRAPGGCGMFVNVETGVRFGTWGVPSVNGVISLHFKKITGSGLSERTWAYHYEPSWSFQSQCNNGCASTSRTSVTTNDGVTRRYVYGNDY